MRQYRKRMKMYYAIAVLVSVLGLGGVAGLYFWQGPQTKTGEEQGASEVVLETEAASIDKTPESEQTEAAEEPETETEDPGPEVVEITISAVGDLTFGRNQKSSYDGTFDEYYDTYGADYFFRNVKEIFEADDCTIGNLEGVLTESTDIRTGKEWNLKGRPEYAKILPANSIDIVGLGNNHIMDYNQEGTDDTKAALEDAGVPYAISGDWGDRYEIYETEKGVKIGIVSVNKVYEGDAVYTYLEEGLEELRTRGADLVFALIHWGTETHHYCNDSEKVMGRWCIDQGYDLVLGSHPHVLQGIECYNGKYIVYSLGNFCFGGNRNPSDKETMIFQQTFTFVDGVLQEDTSAIRAIPCRISSTTEKNDYCPTVLTGDAAETLIGHLNEYSKEFGLVFDNDGYLLEADSGDSDEP